ncbi:MAG TPA: sigma-70 family RNA polymerase sigma factor [Chloroflexaceae bacterium]|nr:sigma-70 family RNA polymerase sigma factor [Chloroflexaceae bacterium]
MPTDDNAALVAACRAGDAAAWETLIRRYQRLIYAIPRRAGLGDDLAAEVFQRVCVALFEHLDRIDRPERLGAWLATTARRESWRQLRQAQAVTSLDMDDEESETLRIADSAMLPDEVLEQAERQHAVRLAMLELDERCQRLLRLLFFQPEPPPYGLIAALLGVPEGSIGPTRARCLRKLQRLLEAHERQGIY